MKWGSNIASNREKTINHPQPLLWKEGSGLRNVLSTINPVDSTL
jgi:hypothetical protein